MSKGGGQGSYQQMQEFNGGGIYGGGIGSFNRGQFFDGLDSRFNATGQQRANEQQAQNQFRNLMAGAVRGESGRRGPPAPIAPSVPVTNMQDFNRRAMDRIRLLNPGMFGQPAQGSAGQRLADQQRAQQQAVAQGGSGGANAITTPTPEMEQTATTQGPETMPIGQSNFSGNFKNFIQNTVGNRFGGGFDGGMPPGGFMRPPSPPPFMGGGFGGFGGFKPQPMPFVRRNTQFRMPSFGPSYGMINPYQGQFSGYGVPSNIASFEQPNYQPFVPPAANPPSGDPPSMVLPPEGGDGTAPPADGGVAGTPPADDGAVQTVSDTTAPVTDAATPLPPIDGGYTPIYQPQPTYVPYRPMPMPTYNPYGSGQFMQDYGGIGGFGRYDLGLAGRQYR